MDYLKVYNGGSTNSDLVKNMTGLYSKNTTVSIPRNQMFVEFETIPNVVKTGFKATILKKSIQYHIFNTDYL